MHPYAVDRMVQERRDELVRLARADRGVKQARRAPTRGRAPARHPTSITALAARLRWPPATRRALEPCPRAPVRPW